MTPAQRKYDQELAASMRHMAVRVAAYSNNVADTLNRGADRIDALTLLVPIDESQPTSTPDQAALEPVRD